MGVPYKYECAISCGVEKIRGRLCRRLPRLALLLLRLLHVQHVHRGQLLRDLVALREARDL